MRIHLKEKFNAKPQRRKEESESSKTDEKSHNIHTNRWQTANIVEIVSQRLCFYHARFGSPYGIVDD